MMVGRQAFPFEMVPFHSFIFWGGLGTVCILGHWALLLNTGKPVDSGDEGLRLVSLHKNECNIYLPEAYGVVGNHSCMYI